MRHRTLIALVLALMVVPATAAMARSDVAPTRAAVSDTAGSDVVTDRAPDRVTDRLTDRPTDVRPCADLRRHVDCCPRLDTDRVTDRCHHDVNLRHLLWRAIQAHEWQLVVRILHALGII